MQMNHKDQAHQAHQKGQAHQANQTDQAHNLTEQATIYHYTLIKKVSHFTPFTIFWGCLLLPFIAVYLAFFGIFALLPLCCSIILLPLLHLLLIRIQMRVQPDVEADRLWAFLYAFPWIGWLPHAHVSLRSLLRTQLHLLFVSLLIIGALFPWLDKIWLIALLAIHLWLIVPRLAILLTCRKKAKNGLIKINPRDTSYYLP